MIELGRMMIFPDSYAADQPDGPDTITCPNCTEDRWAADEPCPHCGDTSASVEGHGGGSGG